MSRSNVELVKRLFAAFANRDLDAVAEDLDPELEIRPALVGGIEGVTYRGLEGIERWVADIDETWEEFRIAPEAFRDLGEQILVLGRAFARAREGDIAVEAPAAWLATVREGRVSRFQSFANQEEAFEAVGLER